jgi:hypothetical protein
MSNILLKPAIVGITGPTSATAGTIAVADGTTGKKIKLISTIVVDDNGKISFGSTTTNNYQMYLKYAPTVSNSNYNAARIILAPVFATNDAGVNVGLFGRLETAGAGNYTGENYSLAGALYHSGSGLLSLGSGLFFTGGILGTGGITSFNVIRAETYGTGTGTFGILRGLSIANLGLYNSPTTMYGVYITANTGSVGTSKYGIYIGNQAGAATNNFAIYSAGGINYFADNVGIGETAPETQLEITSTVPYVTVHNSTEEDIDGGREGKIIFKGEQSGGEETVLAIIQASHDGASDDEKADFIVSVNDGNDGSSPTERMRIDSAGLVTVTGTVNMTAGNVLKINAVQVVGAQAANIVAADGSLADITTKFNTLLGYLKTHGLLASV